MVVETSSFKAPWYTKIAYEIQLRCKPLVHNNIKHQKVFKDEQEIKRCMECVEEFSASQIDLEEDTTELAHSCQFQNTIANQKIIKLKTNHIPKGLVPLERLFENNDVYLKLTNKSSDDNIVSCNIKIEQEPKIVKISRALSRAQRQKYVDLIKKYSCVFLDI